MKHLLNDTPLPFGKYNGKTPVEIAADDPGYIVWMYDTLDNKFCTKELRDVCEEAYNEDWVEEKDLDNFYGFDGW